MPTLERDCWELEHSATLESADTAVLEVPQRLVREFDHDDYLRGAEFLKKIAAVALINNHFPPKLSLERSIFKKGWKVVTRVECRTQVLGGLSRHDFHLAMVRMPSVRLQR